MCIEGQIRSPSKRINFSYIPRNVSAYHQIKTKINDYSPEKKISELPSKIEKKYTKFETKQNRFY